MKEAKWFQINKVPHPVNMIHNPHQEEEKDSHLQTPKEFPLWMLNRSYFRKIQPLPNMKKPFLERAILFPFVQNMKIRSKGIKMYPLINLEIRTWGV